MNVINYTRSFSLKKYHIVTKLQCYSVCSWVNQITTSDANCIFYICFKILLLFFNQEAIRPALFVCLFKKKTPHFCDDVTKFASWFSRTESS
jgi:hypothetical protein